MQYMKAMAVALALLVLCGCRAALRIEVERPDGTIVRLISDRDYLDHYRWSYKDDQGRRVTFSAGAASKDDQMAEVALGTIGLLDKKLPNLGGVLPTPPEK